MKLSGTKLKNLKDIPDQDGHGGAQDGSNDLTKSSGKRL